MRKIFIVSIISVFTILLKAQTFYVSPSGSDGNNGTLSSPFRTFQRSLDAIRDYGGRGIVYFRGGYYHFDKTVIINNENCPSYVTFAAYPHEHPIFTSGIHVTGWEKITPQDKAYKFLPKEAQNKVYVAPIPKGLGLMRFLVDRQSDWLEQGRINVTKYVTTKKYIHGESVEGQMWDPNKQKMIATFSRSMKGLSNVDSALMFAIYTADFAYQILPVREIKGDTLITAAPGEHRLALPVQEQRHGSTQLAFIYNLVEGINTPGKWACNPSTRKIYLWPKRGTAQIYAPSLNELIKIEGVPSGKKAWFTKGKEYPVSHITFSGISFTNCKEPVWGKKDVAAQHGWAMLDKDNALLRFRGAGACKVVNCNFYKSGGAGIAFDLFAEYNSVKNCKFNYLGYEAVRFAGYGIGSKDENKYNSFEQNEISYVDEIHQYDAAIVLWNTGFNKIIGNYLHNLINKAILLSAPRSRSFTKAGQKFFPKDSYMREQAWPMARWSEIPDSALATIYYAHEGKDNIRRVEVDGIKQGDKNGGLADRRCSYYRYLRGNLVERNIISQAAEGLFCDGIFYISGVAAGPPNTIRENYIYNTGRNLPTDKVPFRLVYLDGYSGKFNFIGNVGFNDEVLFELTAFYNWWDKVNSYANVFFNVNAANYSGGVGNLFYGKGPNDPQKKYVNEYWNLIGFLKNYSAPAPHPLPGADLIINLVRNTIEGIK